MTEASIFFAETSPQADKTQTANARARMSRWYGGYGDKIDVCLTRDDLCVWRTRRNAHLITKLAELVHANAEAVDLPR